MKTFLISLFALSILSNLHAAEKRTDGPPGSEYADFSKLEGDLSFGAQFGALLSTRSHQNSSFAVGVDGDYRPYALFGFRFTALQGLSSPRSSTFSLTPLLHTKISNFEPYVLAGPSVAIVTTPSTKAKFAVSIGVGADIDLTQHLGLGMLWTYHSIIDSSDLHALTARISYKF
ncbi:MAG: hypothetical protein JWQ35_2622 [Bacteriovoracaceae bacterium]|nr:hypothetical protein [Bacteriovoracaceae bacterium]